MSRFKRLTDAEARTLTRRELLDRIEAGQAYWPGKKKTMTSGDDAAFREFTRIMHACLPPASIAGRPPGCPRWTRTSAPPWTTPGGPSISAGAKAGRAK